MILSPGAPALAHGFAGDRFFPATLLTDDPFVADEISLPTVRWNPTGPDGSREFDIEGDLAKRITPDLGFTIGDQWQRLKVPGGGATGIGTLDTGLQYQLFVNAPHEAIGLVNLGVSWGHTGRVAALGADDFTTISPGFNFGKGFGDLPNSVPYLRPLAVTGNLGFDFPAKSHSAGSPNATSLNYGAAIEYSLPYLQSAVTDIGLRPPFNRLIPVVEFAFSSPIDNIGLGQTTTGTIQPGIIWAGQYFQIGAEAIIPATRATGHGIGGVVQLHLYLDDLLPKSLGRPISQWAQ